MTNLIIRDYTLIFGFLFLSHRLYVADYWKLSIKVFFVKFCFDLLLCKIVF